MISEDSPRTKRQYLEKTRDSNKRIIKTHAKQISHRKKSGNVFVTIGDQMAEAITAKGLTVKLPKWLKPYANPFAAGLGGFYSNLKPVSGCIIPTNFSKPTADEVLYRMQKNGRYFWSNYCVLILIITCIAIVTSPIILIVLSVFVWMWSKVLDDGFKPFKLKVKRNIKVGGMTILSFIGMIYFASGTIFWSLGTGVALSTIHAALYSVPRDEHTIADLELGFLEK